MNLTQDEMERVVSLPTEMECGHTHAMHHLRVTNENRTVCKIPLSIYDNPQPVHLPACDVCFALYYEDN